MLTATTEPDDYTGVFNPVNYVFSYGADKVATFDSITDGGLATVKVTTTMGALIVAGDSVLIAGPNVLYYTGVQRVLSKTNITGGVRLTLDIEYAGLSPEGILVPNKKQTFDLWAGFVGAGSSRLVWQKRDSIVISPNSVSLDYDFEVQIFLKKYFALVQPTIGNDYNISLKYSVVAIGGTPEYTLAKSGFYGFTNPTADDVQNRLPLGEYPIAFLNKEGTEALPVIHSIVDGQGVDNFPDGGDTGFTGWSFEAIPPERTEAFFPDAGYIEAGISGTQGTEVTYLAVLIPNVDAITIGVTGRIRILAGNDQTLLEIRIKYLNNDVEYFPLKTFIGNEEGVYTLDITSAQLAQVTSNIASIGFDFRITTGTDVRIAGLKTPTLATPSIDGGSGEYVVRNILTESLNKVTANAQYYFDGLAGLTYTLMVTLPYSASSIDTVTPALPSWITAVLTDSFTLLITITGTEEEQGDYSAIDYATVDYNTLSVNSLIGCYTHLFTFISGTFEDFRLSFCLSPISEIIRVCPDDVLNFAYLNTAGGYNSVALECTYLNGRSFGGEVLFKTSARVLKRGEVMDVFDTVSISCSVLSRRMLELLMGTRSSIHVLLYNNETLAFDIPVVIEKSDLTTYGNKFNQSQTRQAFTLRKSQEVIIQTQ